MLGRLLSDYALGLIVASATAIASWFGGIVAQLLAQGDAAEQIAQEFSWRYVLEQGPWFAIVVAIGLGAYWCVRWLERKVFTPLATKVIGTEEKPGLVDHAANALESIDTRLGQVTDELKLTRTEMHADRIARQKFEAEQITKIAAIVTIDQLRGAIREEWERQRKIEQGES